MAISAGKDDVKLMLKLEFDTNYQSLDAQAKAMYSKIIEAERNYSKQSAGEKKNAIKIEYDYAMSRLKEYLNEKKTAEDRARKYELSQAASLAKDIRATASANAKSIANEKIAESKRVAAQENADNKAMLARAKLRARLLVETWRNNVKERIAAEKASEKAMLTRTKSMANQWRQTWTDNINKRKEAEKRATTEAANSWTSKWAKAFGTLTRYFSAGMIIAQITQRVRELVTELLAVEKAMYKVAGITGASLQETNKTIDTIYSISSAYGLAVGDVTKFTFEMAKLGKSAEETVKLADSAASLSVILGEDMVTSGKTLVTTMNQFNLTVSESARVAGVFSEVIKNSPMTVADLTTTMQYVGSAAYAAGIEIEDLGNYIEFLSKSGQRASKIGTGLRNVILKMSRDGRDFTTVMNEAAAAGISLEEALDKFGTRGAVAGYLLVSNWERLNEEVRQTPTSIEQISQTIATASSVSDKFLETWNEIKSVFSFLSKSSLKSITGDVNGDIESTSNTVRRLSRDLEESLSSIGISSKSVFDEIYKDGASASDVYEKIINTISESTSKLFFNDEDRKYWIEQLRSDTSEIEGILEKLKSLNESELSFNEASRLISESYASDVGIINNAVYTGVMSLDDANNQLKRFAAAYQQEMEDIGISTVEAAQKSSKALSEWQNIAASMYKPSVQKEFSNLKDELNEWRKIAGELDRGFISGDKRINLNKVKEQRDKREDIETRLKFLCDGGFQPACELLKTFGSGATKGEWKKYLDNRIKEIMSLMNYAIEETKLAYEEGAKGIDDAMDKAKFDLDMAQKPEDFFKGMVDIFGIQKVDVNEYTQYINDLSDKFIEQINNNLTQEVSLLSETARKQTEIVERSIRELQNVLDEGAKDPKLIGNEEWDRGVKAKITDLEKELLEIQRKLIDGVEKLKGDAQKATQGAYKKKTSFLEDMLGLDEKTMEQKFEAIKALTIKYIGELQSWVDMFNDQAHERRMERLNQELDDIQWRYDKESDILSSALKNNLITQEGYEQRKNELEKKRIDQENEVNRQIFEAQKQNEIRQAISNGIASAAQAFIQSITFTAPNYIAGAALGAIGAAIIAAKTAVEVAGIKKRKFVPVKYEDGGLIAGNSHANGGVPFTVNGVSGFEAEGGEYIINRKSVTPRTLPILDSINKNSKYDPTHFENGGVVPSVSESRILQELLRKPLIAQITTKDLDREAKREQKMKERITLWK